MYDIVIVGAGVSGCAIARELSRKRGKILVVEREEDVCCGTTKANSALIHAGYDAAHGSLKAKLNVQGSEMMPALAEELDVPYKQIGSLVVCLSEADRPDLIRLYENGVANGVKGLRIVERDELTALEPNISDEAVAALHAPTAAIICPFALTYALAENAAKNGVKFQFDTEVTGIRPVDGGWKLTTNRGEIETKVVVNAAGVYADKLHNMVSDDTLTIVPRRGDYFLLDRTAGGHVNHTVFQLPGKQGKGVLVTPTVHGNLLIGPTAIDVEDKESVATTRAGLEEVRTKSALTIKNIPLNQTITSFSGLRAREVRREFCIGEVKPGFVDCAGIESPGLSCAPAIGVMVAEIVSGILHLEDAPDFNPRRTGILDPRTLSRAAQAELIRNDPAYGTVVCRCESVTEGEIIDAIHRVPGARSLDGVKRRTRAGMGRCQSGFCGPRVMEILARELGVEQSRITKAGGSSTLIVGINKDRL